MEILYSTVKNVLMTLNGKGLQRFVKTHSSLLMELVPQISIKENWVVPNPDEQEWNDKNQYTGIFHFRFWKYGNWYDVVVDDYLPTRYNSRIYCRSNTPNEFWSSLLEKAFAKMFGDYESLESGFTNEALVDMTGGIGEIFHITDVRDDEEKRNELFKILHQAIEDHSLMAASFKGKDTEEGINGLIGGHAYSVIDVRNITLDKGLIAFFKREKIPLVKCRNPWGHKEWIGPWSDESEEWNKISKSQKKSLGITVDNNGEFWMPFDDFVSHFENIKICHTINTSIFSLKKTWYEGSIVSMWHGPSGGGKTDNILRNNQIYFYISEDKDDVLISLEQEDQRLCKSSGEDRRYLAFQLIKTDINRRCLMHDKMKTYLWGFSNKTRSVFKRTSLSSGSYCLIVHCDDDVTPNKTLTFILRIYTSKDSHIRELVDDVPEDKRCCLSCFGAKSYTAATQIHIQRADGLEKQEKHGADPFVIVKWEDHKEVSTIQKNTVNPVWDCRFTCYRKDPRADITIEVWNHNLIKDTFMGTTSIEMDSLSDKWQNKELSLVVKGKQSDIVRPGTLLIRVRHTDDLYSV